MTTNLDFSTFVSIYPVDHPSGQPENTPFDTSEQVKIALLFLLSSWHTGFSHYQLAPEYWYQFVFPRGLPAPSIR